MSFNATIPRRTSLTCLPWCHRPYLSRWSALRGLACSAEEALHSVQVCTGEPGPWVPAWVPRGSGERSRSAGRRAAARAEAACVGTGWNVVAVGRGDGAIAQGRVTSPGCPGCWPWPAAVLQACGVAGSWMRPVPANPSVASATAAAVVVAAAEAGVAAANFAGRPCSYQAGPFEPWAPSDPWARHLPAWPSAAASGFASN